MGGVMSMWETDTAVGATGPWNRMVYTGDAGVIVADGFTGVVIGYDNDEVLATAIADGDVVVDGRSMVAVP
jgi:hypothetical protein